MNQLKCPALPMEFSKKKLNFEKKIEFFFSHFLQPQGTKSSLKKSATLIEPFGQLQLTYVKINKYTNIFIYEEQRALLYRDNNDKNDNNNNNIHKNSNLYRLEKKIMVCTAVQQVTDLVQRRVWRIWLFAGKIFLLYF